MAKIPIYVNSATTPKKKYLLVYDDQTGLPLFCNCPAYTYHNPFRQFCKHMLSFKAPEKKT